MCGGRGTRLDAPREKPLFEVAGRPLLARVLDALDASRTDAVHAAVSPHAPETAAFLDSRAVSTIETPGEGYVADLDAALDALEPPVLTVAADLPLLDGAAVNRVLDARADDGAGGSLHVCVPAALKRRLGASADATYDADGRTVAPSGVNVVDPDTTDTMHLSYDARYAVNVNRPGDAALAEALL